MTACSILLVSVPTQESGRQLSRNLVEERLAACVHLLPAGLSTYRWQNKVCEEAEQLLIIKSSNPVLPTLIPRIQQLHPYEVPEIIVLPISDGLPAYLDWLVQETAVPDTGSP